MENKFEIASRSSGSFIVPVGYAFRILTASKNGSKEKNIDFSFPKVLPTGEWEYEVFNHNDSPIIIIVKSN